MSLLLAFSLTVLAIELTPGPNMSYLAIVGMRLGRPAGLAAVLGVALGLAILGLLVGFGADTLIAAESWTYHVLLWAGSVYMLWLAYDCWREGDLQPNKSIAAETKWKLFRQGLTTNLLNPKAAIFFVAVLPKFVDPNQPLEWQLLELVALYVSIATAVHLAVVLFASLLQPILFSASRRRATSTFFALMLVGVSIWLVL